LHDGCLYFLNQFWLSTGGWNRVAVPEL